MCTSPITVKNPIKHFIPVVDKPKLVVPCGHCWECRSRKRNDYLVRCFFEYMHCQKNHGFAYFQTLTYDNFHLPKFAYYDKNNIMKSTGVFSSSDIRSYIDVCKSSLRRKFGCDLVNGHVKYFLTCEYGSDGEYIDDRGKLRRATHRPHYHLIWFVSSSINRWRFREIVLNSWQDGRTYDSEQNYGFIQGLGAIKYVSKYVSKSIDNTQYLQKTLSDIPEKMRPQYLSYSKPFIRLSSANKKKGIPSFGEIGVTKINGKYPFPLYVNDSLLKDGFVLLPDKDTGFKKYCLPMQLQRCLYYDKFTNITIDEDGKKHYSGLFYLNKDGRDMKKHKLNMFVSSVEKRLAQLTNFTPNSSFFDFINKNSSIKFKTIQDVKQFTQQVSDLKSFALASVVYNGYNEFTNVPCYSSVISPKEDYYALLDFDRNAHTLEDFTYDGIKYRDLFESVANNSNHFHNDYNNDLGLLLYNMVNYFGSVKEQEQTHIEHLCEVRNKYLKQFKKRIYYGKENNYSPITIYDE